MQIKNYFIPVSILIITLTGCAESTVQWHTLGQSKEIGISGLAVIDKEHYLAVHDGKKPKHARLSIVTWQTNPSLKTIDWCDQANFSIDLEAITAIPKHERNYLVLESKGRVSRIQLDSVNHCKITSQFNLPTATAESNMEGLAVHCFENDCLLVWAERGDDKHDAKFSWAKFDVNNNRVATPEGKPFEFNANYLPENHRSITDIAIDIKGSVWISAASDPGDDGPFVSAIHQLGTFTKNGLNISWDASTDFQKPKEEYKKENIKIEAIAFTDDGMIMATDDENKGSKIAIKP